MNRYGPRWTEVLPAGLRRVSAKADTRHPGIARNRPEEGDEAIWLMCRRSKSFVLEILNFRNVAGLPCSTGFRSQSQFEFIDIQALASS